MAMMMSAAAVAVGFPDGDCLPLMGVVGEPGHLVDPLFPHRPPGVAMSVVLFAEAVALNVCIANVVAVDGGLGACHLNGRVGLSPSGATFALPVVVRLTHLRAVGWPCRQCMSSSVAEPAAALRC